MESKVPFFDGDYSFNTGTLKQFSILDYCIFGAVLLVSASIGFYFAYKDKAKKNIEDFMLAGRNMNPLPVSLSLLASFMSAITLLGTPAEMYNFTTMYIYICFGYVLVIAGAAHLYIPVFYRLNTTSAYAYLERRFSQGVRTAASLTFVLQMILYMALVLYAPSLALNAVTGFSLWGAVISVGLVCTIYTAFGGMKAVLWTDSFQVIMMFVGLITVLIQGCIIVGDWNKVLDSAYRANRIWWTDFRADPSVRHSFWSLTLGCYFTWVAVFGTNQAQIQRCITTSSLKKAQLAMWINLPGLCLIMILASIIGLVMSAFYERCDPLKAEFVTDSNQLLPMFVMDILGDVPGLPGLFVAGLFSGALSTISSGLNSISAAILEDVIKAYFVKDMKEAHGKYYCQVISFVFGGICLGLTFVASQLGSVLQAALSLFGMIGGPVLGVFTLGMVYPWANKWGAFSGLFTSLIFMFWIGVGAQIDKPIHTKAFRFTDHCNLTAFPMDKVMALNATSAPADEPERSFAYPLYSLSYLWYSATAVLTCNVVGLVVSFLTGPTKASDIDPNLMIAPCDIIYPLAWLPERIRKPLRFGVDYSKQTPIPMEAKSREKTEDFSNAVYEKAGDDKDKKGTTTYNFESEDEKQNGAQSQQQENTKF